MHGLIRWLLSSTALLLVVHVSLWKGVDAWALRVPPIATKVVATVVCGWTLATTTCQAADVAAGSQIFDSNCAQCHAGGQNVIAKERTLQFDVIEKYVGINNVQPFVQTSITHRGALFFGKNKLTDQDLANVAAFVVEQATEDKWPSS